MNRLWDLVGKIYAWFFDLETENKPLFWWKVFTLVLAFFAYNWTVYQIIGVAVRAKWLP